METKSRYIHPILETGFLKIARSCDGASSRDNVGFDGSDAQWGKRVMGDLYVGYMSPDDQRRCLAILPKYHRQLGELINQLPSESDLDDFLVESEASYKAAKAVEQQAKIKELKARYKACVSEAESLNLSATHTQLLAGLLFTSDKSDFVESLISRAKAGRNLSEKQQLAAVGVLQRDESLFLAGASPISKDDVSEFLNNLEESLPQKAPGKVEVYGHSLLVSFDYDPEKVFKIKELKAPKAKWKSEAKVWEVAIEHYPSLVERFPDFEYDPKAKSLYEEVQSNIFLEREEAIQGIQKLIDAADVNGTLANGWSLYHHQKDTVRWGINQIESTDLRGVLYALDMGLGKTVSALVTARAYHRLFDIPVLVVCPASLMENWRREAEIAQVPIEIFSWAKQPKPLELQKYVIIFDEAHYAQAGKKSNRGKQFLELTNHPNCRASLLLTGTPIKNGRPSNLKPLLQAINHPVVKDSRGYDVRYCAAKPTRFTQWDVSGAAHLDELSRVIKDGVIRKTKKECLDLPAKIRVFKPSTVEGDRLKAWKQALKDANKRYQEDREEFNNAAAIVLLNSLRKAGSHAKVDTIVDLASEVLEQNQQVVIFTEFLESAKELHKILGGELLIGETPNEERQAMVDRFQSGKSKVFISTSKAGGVGITLTASSTVILGDRPWTPGDSEQCEDRCYRIGQNEAVTAIWVQWSDIDEKVDSILAQKYERIELVLSGQRKTLRGIKNPKDMAKELLLSLLESEGSKKD